MHANIFLCTYLQQNSNGMKTEYRVKIRFFSSKTKPNLRVLYGKIATTSTLLQNVILI